MKFLTYVTVSTLSLASIIYYAHYRFEQFYPTGVYLMSGKFNQIVLANFCIMSTILFGIFIKKLSLGRLRESEMEQLTDRILPTIFDYLLLTTIFSAELDTKFFVYFVVLLFLSVFHWMARDRVDFIEASAMTFLQYTRLFCLLISLLFVDIIYTYYVFLVTYHNGPSILLLFGFEYALLTWYITTCIVKFFLNIIDLKREQWHNKAAFVLCVEFAEDSLRLLTLMSFFATVLTFYGVPYHLIRRINISYRSFYRKFLAVKNYIVLMKHINSLQPATQEELQNVGMCIICRTEMEEGQKLPCGHIFHATCFRGWLGRSHECPICRRSLLELIQQQNQPLPQFNQFIQPPFQNQPIPQANQFQFPENQFQPQFQPQPEVQPPQQPPPPQSIPQPQPNLPVQSPQRQNFPPTPPRNDLRSPLNYEFSPTEEKRETPSFDFEFEPNTSNLLEATSLQIQQVDRMTSQISQLAEEIRTLKSIIILQQNLLLSQSQITDQDNVNNYKDEERIPKDDTINSEENDLRKRRLLRFSGQDN